MVIGRFDQLYQNFRGFDSIESARIFLAVFEKVYRFTPFSDDAQSRIRGKSPVTTQVVMRMKRKQFASVNQTLM